MKLKRGLIAVSSLVLSTSVIISGPAMATAIGSGDFSSSATVTTFDGLALPIHGNPTPYILDGNTYETDNSIFRYLTPGFCPGECFGTDTDGGFIDITFGTPYKLVGLHAGPGANDPDATGEFWNATVEFFNASNILIGNIPLTGGQPATLEFAGWEDASGIASIRITDTDRNGLVALINDVTFEAPVPLPTAVWLFSSGLFGLSVMSRRKKIS